MEATVFHQIESVENIVAMLEAISTIGDDFGFRFQAGAVGNKLPVFRGGRYAAIFVTIKTLEPDLQSDDLVE